VKRSLLIAVLAMAAVCWMMPCETLACGRFGHRLRAVARVPLRVVRAPVRLVRTIRQRRCGCGPACYCGPAAAPHVRASDCETGACLAQLPPPVTRKK